MKMDDYKILPARFNVIFTSIFTHPKNKDRVLLAFLRHYLRKPGLISDNINVSDPRIAVDDRGEKYPVIDVRITLPGLKVHLEMQLKIYSDTRDRILYYHSKIHGEQLKKGDLYKDISKLITLCITNAELINECPDYFFTFMMHDAKHSVTLTETSRIDVLELSKIPEDCDNSPEWIWGSLFKANEEEEFDMLASRYPEVQGAVAAIKELSADPNVRHQALIEEMEWRDWISWTDEAESKGREQGIEIGHKQGLEQGLEQGIEQGLAQGEYKKACSIAKNLMKADLPLEMIIMVTGLTREEVDHLRMMN